MLKAESWIRASKKQHREQILLDDFSAFRLNDSVGKHFFFKEGNS